MVDLDSETIDVVKRIKDSLDGSSYKMSNISIGKTGADGDMIIVDVRRHKK